jgi:hypothetical protein
MLRLSASVCVNAPVKKVWTALSKLDAIQDWSGSIHRSYCESEQTRGVDTVRVCELGRNVTVRETIVAWEEGRSFTYIGQGIPFLKRAQNTWSVEARGEQTIVLSKAEVEFKGGLLGRMFEPILLLVSQREARKSLVAFKFLVENGKPYEGNTKTLFKLSLTC